MEEFELHTEVGAFFLRRGWQKGIHNWVADMVGAGADTFVALRSPDQPKLLAQKLEK